MSPGVNVSKQPYIVASTPDHVATLSSQLKPADRVELLAAEGRPIPEILMDALNDSVCTWTLMQGEEPQAIGGLVAAKRVGIPWMVSNENIRLFAKFMRQQYPQYLSLMQSIRPHLTNYVHLENKISIRWLVTMGFKFAEVAPIGVNGELFARFYRNV